MEEENEWTLTIVHIAGKLNQEADALSRLSIAGDYSIKKEVLEDDLKDWQEILYIGEGKKSERMRFNESLLGGGVCINTSTDTNNKQGIKENNRGQSLRNNDSTTFAGQVWWTQLKQITVREKELKESEKVLEMGSKMKKRNLKVPPGRILALEVNGDKREQDCSEIRWKLPDNQEMQLDLQQITGMEVWKGTRARYQPFGSI
ncbi:MAG: hypothetical protein EZS28_043574 [Streblomastix strix]|uniref:Reverse transcriptase RNase H-like domain-containing protein n=1 Tax=Streblomastix strix TaxID=222440 RepID=A0A5J4TSE3_9EUKA|nr:MAG: hypothetical protein EZS28_043574 [Streblomastix strix]